MVKLLTVEKGATLNRLSIVNIEFLAKIGIFDITTYHTSIVFFGAEWQAGVLFYFCLLYSLSATLLIAHQML